MIAEVENTDYDQTHGGAYDRGSADAYYGRRFDPHMYPSGTYKGQRISLEKGTPEYEAYAAGYESTVQEGNFKNWD